MKFVRIFDPKSEIDFIAHAKIVWIISLIVSLTSLAGLIIFGINWGIDFAGGMELQVKFQKPVAAGEIRELLEEIDFDKNQVQQFGAMENNEMLVRVERVSMMREKDLEHYKNIVSEAFVPKKEWPKDQPHVMFEEKSGNKAYIWLEAPDLADEADAKAIKDAYEDQRVALLNLLQNKGTIELRLSKASAEAKEDVDDSVIADQPKDGYIRYTVFFGGVSNKIQQALIEKFGQAEIRRVDFVDSQISKQLRTDGLLAVVYALIAMLIYIAIRFDLFFSPGAVITLSIDILAAMWVFVVFRKEFDTPSIAALLTILGYSINNTIVIYDRIRETVPDKPKKPLSVNELKPYINKAINDTFSRTINTTLTTQFSIMALWIFTSGSIQIFSMVLMAGVTFGALTSTFISPSMYLIAKKYIKPSGAEKTHSGPTREDRAKGVV